jgi:hypothetical protein
MQEDVASAFFNILVHRVRYSIVLVRTGTSTGTTTSSNVVSLVSVVWAVPVL